MKKIFLNASCILLSASSLFASDPQTDFDAKAPQRAHILRGQGAEYGFSQYETSKCFGDVSNEEDFSRHRSSPRNTKQEEIDQIELKIKHNQEMLETRGKIIEELKRISREKKQLLDQQNAGQLKRDIKKVSRDITEAEDRMKKSGTKYYSESATINAIALETEIQNKKALIDNSEKSIQQLTELLEKSNNKKSLDKANGLITKYKQSIKDNKERLAYLQLQANINRAEIEYNKKLVLRNHEHLIKDKEELEKKLDEAESIKKEIDKMEIKLTEHKKIYHETKDYIRNLQKKAMILRQDNNI